MFLQANSSYLVQATLFSNGARTPLCWVLLFYGLLLGKKYVGFVLKNNQFMNNFFTPNSTLDLFPLLITTIGEACYNMLKLVSSCQRFTMFSDWRISVNNGFIYFFHIMTVSVNSSESILLHCDSYWVCLVKKLYYYSTRNHHSVIEI